jgi:hypothetical protein
MTLLFCLYTYVFIGGKIEGRRRRGRIRKQVLGDLKEARGFCKLKEEPHGCATPLGRSGATPLTAEYRIYSAVRLGFMVNKMIQGQGFLRVFRFARVSIILPMPHTFFPFITDYPETTFLQLTFLTHLGDPLHISAHCINIPFSAP